MRRAKAYISSSSCLQIVLVYLLFGLNSVLKCRSQKSQKTLKPLLMEVQSHSMSLMLVYS